MTGLVALGLLWVTVTAAAVVAWSAGKFHVEHRSGWSHDMERLGRCVEGATTRRNEEER